MMALVHLTGDTALLDGPIRPNPAIMGENQGSLSEEDRAAVRAHALEVIRTHRDGGGQMPAPPSAETIHRMMSFMVGQEVPAEYLPMMLEELALEGGNARAVDWGERATPAARERFRVLVIGAGMSGLLAAIRLQEAGVSYEIVEKNDGVGGTWLENRYPGCRVDIANHFYCYSFAPNDWSEFFSQRAELHEYFERCARDYGVREHIRFRTEVLGARFDEARSLWHVRLRGADGAEETIQVNAVISAVGQLNRPRIPEIDGLDSFAGPYFHSARWQPQHRLAGRRVAVVGSGASALQLVPEVAKEAAELRVFQRSPAWMFPNPSYHAKVDEGARWLLSHLPYYARWFRFLLFWPGSDGLLPSLVIDPAWPHAERAVNHVNDQMRVLFTDAMRAQIDDDPELLEKVIPRYPPFGKRMLQDDGSWLRALQRENVELVTEAIREIEPDAIVTGDGRRHPADVIVFATGFHANKFLWPMEIVGRGGVVLSEQWGEDPSAYLGITAPGFPNLFSLYGPATNLAHAGSIIFHSECQVRYVEDCLRELIERGAAAMECRQEVHDAYRERLQRELSRMVWSHPGMTSWYKNRHGRVTTTSPWRLVDYWRWTRSADPDDFHWS